MKRKNPRFRSIIALITMLALCLSLCVTQAFAVTQEEIDEIQRQKDELTAMRQQSQQKVDELEAQQASVLEQKAALDERNLYALEQISLISEQIDLYSEMIADKAREVETAKEKEEQQLKRYRERVRAMEEQGEFNFLALILNTTNLGELLTLLDDIGEIMESDRNLEDEYIAAREETERVKAEYEAVKTELEAKQAELKTEQEELERQIEEAYELIASLQEDIDKAMAEYEINMAAEDEMVAHFNAMSAQFAREQEEARRAAEQAAAAAGGGGSGGSTGGGGGSVTGSGSFIWPVPSCTIITSRYGNRFHLAIHTEQSGRLHGN